ncbi:MAG: polyprenyl diphosphate synthase [Rickettsiaceae bacterium]
MIKHNIKHLAIILDGNGRWAKKNNKSRYIGYKNGAQNLHSLIPTIIENDIEYFTVFAFSSENWQRPKREIILLIKLLEQYLMPNTLEEFMSYSIRLKVIGNLEKFNTKIQSQIKHFINSTKNNKITLCIALSYGSKEEIIHACRTIANDLDSNSIKNLTEDNFKQYLYDPEMPDVDLLIRPGNVFRISNFLLWQSAYAELYFSEKYWPDFNKEDLIKAIYEYTSRKRTFGK